MGDTYYLVQLLRPYYRDGRLDVATLPPWADRELLPSGPRLVDFRRQPEVSFVRYTDQLAELARDNSIDVDYGDIRRCNDELDQGLIVSTEGRK